MEEVVWKKRSMEIIEKIREDYKDILAIYARYKRLKKRTWKTRTLSFRSAEN